MSTTINVQHDYRQDTPNVIHQVSAPHPVPLGNANTWAPARMSSTCSCVFNLPFLLLPTLTQSYLAIPMRHVRSLHLCPKAVVNSLVAI